MACNEPERGREEAFRGLRKRRAWVCIMTEFEHVLCKKKKSKMLFLKDGIDAFS